MVRKAAGFLLLIVLFLIPALGSFAEGDLSMELGISNLILQTRKTESEITGINPITNDTIIEYSAGDKYWGWLTTGSAEFSFKSRGNKNVKADLAFSFAAPETDLSMLAGAEAGTILMPALTLERAYVKARFPGFRITAGKTRLGWGEGFIFNSGDLIFGSTDTTVDLTASEIRTETQWLTALNIPLGRFSFIEGVILPPVPRAEEGFTIGKATGTSGGGRLYTKLAGIKIEGGYYFDQSNADNAETSGSLHKAYLGFQGNLLADWYLSSSVSLPVTDQREETAKNTFNISGGLFHMISLNSISSLTFRLESLYRPFHSWEETTRTSGEDIPTYALLLYPEIGWTPTDTVNLSLRSIWSPIDKSAMITAGAGWNIFEGFDFSCYTVFNAGDGDDIFSWDRDMDLWKPGTDLIDSTAVIIGINYIY